MFFPHIIILLYFISVLLSLVVFPPFLHTSFTFIQISLVFLSSLLHLLQFLNLLCVSCLLHLVNQEVQMHCWAVDSERAFRTFSSSLMTYWYDSSSSLSFSRELLQLSEVHWTDSLSLQPLSHWFRTFSIPRICPENRSGLANIHLIYFDMLGVVKCGFIHSAVVVLHHTTL